MGFWGTAAALTPAGHAAPREGPSVSMSPPVYPLSHIC
jgi:hypothetical protein